MEIDKELERQVLLDPLLSRHRNEDPHILLLISSDALGRGNIHLGRKLMYSFLYSLTEVPPKIRTIILINSGVKLGLQDAKPINSLKLLNDAKINIIICQESLHYYGSTSLLEVGRPVSMYTITNMLLSAEQVITL